MRLILLDVFKQENSRITNILKILYRICSTLFKSLLFKADRRILYLLMKEHKNENKNNIWTIQFDNAYSYVIAIEYLAVKYYREILRVLTRISDDIFIISLFKL